ncbi:MAG: DUF1824 family protein [Cyanobacteria bacterium J06632_3]
MTADTSPANPPADDEPTAELLAQLKAIRQYLIKVSLVHEPADLSDEQKQTVRDHLLWLNEQSEYQTLGICASTLGEAETALKSYVGALSQPIRVDIPPQDGAVFLKFNTLKNAWYVDGYTGDSRGVLVTYHTSEPELDDVNGTYGPFPLDLF